LIDPSGRQAQNPDEEKYVEQKKAETPYLSGEPQSILTQMMRDVLGIVSNFLPNLATQSNTNSSTTQQTADTSPSNQQSSPAGQSARPVPVSNTEVTSEFSNGANRTITTNNGLQSRPHRGIDLAASVGTPVVAVEAGTLRTYGSATRTTGFGLFGIISHNGDTSSVYGHLSRVLISNNSRVSRGDTIGLSGRSGNVTGPHLHFEVRVGNTSINPSIFVPSLDTLPRR
ncbi:MAG: M23 family metallopeptidase, partial [Methanobacteriota archaeon]